MFIIKNHYWAYKWSIFRLTFVIFLNLSTRHSAFLGWLYEKLADSYENPGNYLNSWFLSEFCSTLIGFISMKYLSKYYTESSDFISGMKGGLYNFFISTSQSRLINHGWFLISSAPFAPSLFSGSLVSNPKTKL